METVSAVNQTLPISGDETEKFTTYSSAVHKVVVMINTGILGLLQLTNQKSSVFETHKAEFLCFCVFVLLYAVFRVREAMDVRLQPGLVPRLVGNTSHLFGALAALVLVSVVCSTFALVLLLLWLLWLSAVVYNTSSEFLIYLKANKSGAGLPQLPQLPPV
ncbi:unnamed protein product [Thlaspi arvense]|uniref:PRA1 family protein n=1 Tax=Thlaspi arvense TaxID=13288 RepID=A0AAU9R6K7_THLAR|nr:unnamed protein product [Thlaspi arvense]CAH2034831.1 unnamed protein product [Thlaspi arvense]